MERDKKIHHPLLCRYFVTVGSVLGWGREKEREGKKKKKEKEKKKKCKLKEGQRGTIAKQRLLSYPNCP